MQRGIIEINNDIVTVTPSPDGTVWMSPSEMARLLGVFVPAVTNNIRAMYKAKTLYEEDTMYREDLPHGGFIDLYNLEMLVALAFRVNSHHARILRQWVVKRLLKSPVMYHLPISDTSIN